MRCLTAHVNWELHSKSAEVCAHLRLIHYLQAGWGQIYPAGIQNTVRELLSKISPSLTELNVVEIFKPQSNFTRSRAKKESYVWTLVEVKSNYGLVKLLPLSRMVSWHLSRWDHSSTFVGAQRLMLMCFVNCQNTRYANTWM